MSLEKLEHIVNFSFKSDMLNIDKALDMINAEIDESIMENTYSLTNLPFFTSEIINGEIKFIETDYFTIDSKVLRDFMAMLLQPDSHLYKKFVSCPNDIILSNNSKYHHLTRNADEWNGIYTPLLIYYHLLKSYGQDAPLFKLFKLLLNRDYNYILAKSAENRMDVINFIEWILEDENHQSYQTLFVENSPNGRNENISAPIYIQSVISNKMTHKIDIGLHLYLEPFLFLDNIKNNIINLLQEQTGDENIFCAFETSMRLLEIKANLMRYKYTHYQYSYEFSDFDKGAFAVSSDKPSFFNFSPTLCCYIPIENNDNDNGDYNKRTKFITEYDYDNLSFDDMDLLNMLLKSSTIDDLFDIEVI